MSEELKTIQRKIEVAQNAQDSVTAMMERVFPEGKEIAFKRGNMKKRAYAIVIWARMINGYAELGITNTKTNKDRIISFNDVVEI